MEEIRVSVFANHKAYACVKKGVTEVVRLIQYDSIIAERTRQYRETMAAMGKKTADEHIKRKLMPVFGVAVTFKGLGHSAEQAEGWTGLAMCDIDHIDNVAELEAAFERLRGDPHVLMMYRSIGGKGLHIIYHYVRENGQKIDDTSWRAAFYVGNEYLSHVAGHPFDEACNDYTRLSGMASDPGIYFNPEAEPFNISDELLVEQNCEYQEHGRPRKEYGAGTFHPEPEEAWPRVERILAEKQLAYMAGHHHDYVLHASYLFNRFGVPLEALLGWASREWADYPEEERERAIRHPYKKTERHGTWKLTAKKRDRENTMITLPELRQWLDEHVEVRYNIVTDQLVWRERTVRKATPQEQEEEIPLTSPDWKPVDETEINTRRFQIAFDTGKRVLKPDVESIYKSDFARKVHPIRQFIERLPEWDGHDRMTELAAHVHAVSAAEDQTDQQAQEHLCWTLHKWLVGMVATWMDDKVQNQCIFTIIGTQGIYKTTFFRHLLPPPLHSYFLENSHNSFSSKDDRIALTENCLVEIEEVDALEGKELSELKGLVTAETIKERRPYGKFREQKPRLASFCASGNEQKILTDSTGNRRWLCHQVSSIDNPREWNLDYEQFDAQLRHELRNGFQYWFDKREENRVAVANLPFLVIGFEEELISTRLRKPKDHEAYKLMNATMIALYINGGHISPGLSTRKIGDVMHKLKFSYIHKRSGNFYKVVEIPFDQQQKYIELSNEVENDETESTQLPDAEQLDLPF